MYTNGHMGMKDLIDVLVRHQKTIWLTTALFVLVALVANLMLPKWYESNTNLRVKYSRSTNDTVGTLSQEEVMRQQIYTYAEIVKGKTVVEAAIRKVYGNLPETEQPTYEEMVKRIDAKPIKNTEILNVTVRAKSPEEAQALGNALVEILLSRLTDIVRLEGRETKNFIGQRLEDAKANLATIEKQIVDFKEANRIYSVNDQTKNILDRETTIKKMMIDNRMAIQNSQAKAVNTNREIAEEAPGFVGNSPLIEQYKGKLEDMEVELIGLKKTYKDSHPKVQSLQASINNMKDVLAAEINRVANAQAPSGNPVHQALLQSKLQAEVDLAGANAQNRALNQEVGSIQNQLLGQPQKEQGLIKLLRDSAVAEQSYMELAKEYDQARIEEVKEPTNVQIVDTPDLPTKAATPHKLLNLAAALILGLFCGTTLAFVFEVFYQTINTTADISHYLGVNVLAAIPKLQTQEEKKTVWHRWARAMQFWHRKGMKENYEHSS